MKSWMMGIGVLAVFLFVVWIFFGRGTHEFVGLQPLDPNVPILPYLKRSEIEELLLDRPNTIQEVQRSKGERLCCRVMEEIYGKTFYRARPDFLKTETGHNLELDCYNAELKMAVEYNGEQHYRHPNFLNMTEEQFLNGVKRDLLKVKLCDEAGVYLITVPYHVKHNKIRDYIVERLP